MDVLSATYHKDSDSIYVIALVDDVTYVKGSQTLYDPPEYIPAKMYDFVQPSESDDIDISSMSEDQLKQWIEENSDSINFDWKLYEE